LKSDNRLQLEVQDGYFPVDHPETQVIEDSKTLKAFYAKVNRTRKPGLPVPEVDFSTQRIVVACMGAVSTESLPIMSIKKETEDEIILSVHLTADKSNTTTQSYPFCVYRISNEGKRVTVAMN
jgi:hypothetical protein